MKIEVNGIFLIEPPDRQNKRIHLNHEDSSSHHYCAMWVKAHIKNTQIITVK